MSRLVDRLREQIEATYDIPTMVELFEETSRDQDPIHHSETISTLLLRAHRFVSEQFVGEGDVRLTVELSTTPVLEAVTFYEAAAATVFQRPALRSDIDLYYVEGQSETHATGIEGDGDGQTGVELEYTTRDLSDRIDRLESHWEALAEDGPAGHAAEDEVASAIEQLRVAVDNMAPEVGLETVHDLDDAIFTLGNRVDSLAGEGTQTPAVERMASEVDRFETAVVNLRKSVRRGSTRLDDEELATIGREPGEAGDQPVADASSSHDEQTAYRLPLPPAQQSLEPGEIRTDLLHLIDEEGPFDSISELASTLADRRSQKYDESYRSKVQYNVRTLAERGYVERERVGRGYRTSLSTPGWVRLRLNDE